MRKLMIFVLGIFLISSVYALGVSPGRTTVDFVPGQEREFSFEIINADGENMHIEILPQGDLAKYIILSESEAVISPEEKSKKFFYTLKMPQELEPGVQTGGIYIVQTASGENNAIGSQISATLAVKTQINLHVPYPGKYARAKLYVNDKNNQGKIRFTIPVVSAGKFDLDSVRASVDVYNKMNEKVESFSLGPISVKAGTKKELVHEWEPGLPVGEYRAEALLIYEEGTLELEEFFKIGSEDLELIEIIVNDFRLGEIVKLEMLVENMWSEAISEAYIETKIFDSQGVVASKFRSSTYDIAALSKQSFASYWDTAGVEEGIYETEVSINYGDKSVKKNLEFEVTQNDLNVIGLGYVVSSGGSGESNTMMIVLITVIVVLVLLNILWFFMFRKMWAAMMEKRRK